MSIDNQKDLKEIIDRFLREDISQRLLFIIPHAQDRSVGEKEIIVRNMLLDIISTIDYKYKFFPVDMFEVSVDASDRFCGRLENVLGATYYEIEYDEKMAFISEEIKKILEEKANSVGDKIVVIYNISSVKDTFDFNIERIIDIFSPSRMVIIWPSTKEYTSSLSLGKIERINV